VTSTIGIAAVAVLTAQCRRSVARNDHSDPAADEIGCHGGYPIIAPIGETVFDCDIAAFGIANVTKATAN
jgi:hypothetical protein